jgi:hypothetical protein
MIAGALSLTQQTVLNIARHNHREGHPFTNHDIARQSGYTFGAVKAARSVLIRKGFWPIEPGRCAALAVEDTGAERRRQRPARIKPAGGERRATALDYVPGEPTGPQPPSIASLVAEWKRRRRAS